MLEGNVKNHNEKRGAIDSYYRRRSALSVDVEDYFQVWAFSNVIPRSSWEGLTLRVGESTRRVLDLFDLSGAKATFFTLGWVAERDHGLIREIVDRGHELASHGYDHQKVFDQTPTEFRDDVRLAKEILEDISGVEVVGYRAPGFSVDARSLWAYEVLADVGYRYSSSTHPIEHDHYGDPHASSAPFCPINGTPFIEAPVATTEVFGRRISCAGGGWFRARPYTLSKKLFARAASTLEGPAIFYFHPWEIDALQPRIKGASLKSRLRHYINLSSMEGKLNRLLHDFTWGRIDDALQFSYDRKAA